MKKSNLFKMLLTFICIVAISIVSDKVYGYQLKYKAYKDGVNNTEGALVRTFGQTYGEATPGEWQTVGKDNDNINYGKNYYSTYKIVFHNAVASIYDTSYNENYYYVGYDMKKDGGIFELPSNLTNDILVNKLKVEGINVKGYNTDIYNFSKLSFNSEKCLEYDRAKDNFYLNRKRIINSDDSKETRTLLEWFLSEEVIKNLRTKFNLDSERNFIYFSLPSKTERATWNTTYDMLKDMDKFGDWDPANYGKTVWYLKGNKDGLDKTPGKTALNLFDNQLYIPNEFFAPQEIYIRHVDEEGNLINIANSAEVLISSDNNQSIKYSEESKKNGYQEYYKIYLGEKLRVSRSLTMAVNGKMYKYKKAIVSTAKTFDEAKANDNINLNSNTETDSSFEVGSSDQNKVVTIVTFVYSEDNVPGYPPTSDNPPTPDNPPDDDIPTGDINTEFSSDDGTSDCIQKYTPTDVNITPYLKANKTLLKDLVYRLEKNGNEVIYKIENFNVQKLDGGKMDDNSDYPETGTIYGDELYTLLAANAKKELAIKDFDLTEANTFKDNYNRGSLPKQSEVDAFVKNQSKSKFDDFDLDVNKRKIPVEKYNGLRTPKLYARYKAVNVMNGSDISGGMGYVDANNKVNIIVYNPLDLKDVTVTSKEIINHTTETSSNTNVIQKNAEFTVKFGTKGSSYYAKIEDTSTYLDYYYLFFDIDIVLKSDYQVKERTNTGFTALKTASAGSTVTAGTLIRIKKEDTEFNAIASSNKQGEDIVAQVENNVVLIGVTNNMPSDSLENLIFTNAVKKYVVKNETIEEKYINTTISTNSISFKNYCAEDSSEEVQKHDSKYTSYHTMYSDAYYFAMAKTKTTNVGRIYDFKITDCSDIDYKSVFRKSNKLSSVNDLTGVQYFSGVKLFNIYTNEINTLEDRSNLNIGNNSSAKKIIPLGPYKNTNTTYVGAPKMGYRISFDLKTSGFYDQTSTSTREILIKPSYYYISKDGTNFKDNINLYYKNSSGKYVNFDGSDYTIYFKPKDGYRSIANSVSAGNTSFMSDQLEPLVVGSKSGFTLNSKMMSTADNKFIQAWYGEFKLPNSTIAVEGSNISKPLTDGYVGVKFEITSIDKNASGETIRAISYNQNNKNVENNTNTTQWDYEGFLGFTNYGNEVDTITLQLEKGEWKINNATYQKIKGSVVLFDTDNRAANDFD